MAAVLLLMIGSSLFFLRARPERGASARVSIIERGIPETRDASNPPAGPTTLPASDLRLLEEAERSRAHLSDGPLAASAKSITAKAPPAPAPTAAADREDDDAYAEALSSYEAGDFSEAARRFEALASSEDTKTARLAALYAAKSIEKSSGCEDAVPRYEAVASRFPKTQAANDARWGAASCHHEMGDLAKARELYEGLRDAPKYRERVEKALDQLDARAPSIGATSP